MGRGRSSRHARLEVCGWGRYPVETCDVHRPRDAAEAREVVSESTSPGVIPRGLGRSYGDASLNGAGAVVLSDRLDHVLAFDPDSGVLRAQAAVSFAEIIRHFLPRGFFFPVTPGTKNITIGGAIAADVHGKNHHRSGSMSAFVDRFRLLTASGEVLECSRQKNADAFWATVGGMGLTGMILDAELRLKPVETAFVNADYERVPNVDRLLERMEASDDQFEYAVAWVDSLASGSSLGRSVLMRANHAARDGLPPSHADAPYRFEPSRRLAVPLTLPDFTLNPLSMRIFNAAFHARHRTRQELTDCDRFFYPLDSVEHWNRAYGKRGVLQYQCVIPEAHAHEGVVRLLEALQGARVGSFLTVLKSLGDASEGLLSFPIPGKTLAMDVPFTGPELTTTLNELDEIVASYGGRVYLAKDSCLRRETFERMYPRIGEFKKIKAALDPEGRFDSSLARRLGITGSE